MKAVVQSMVRSLSLSLLAATALVAVGCGEDSPHVRVELEITTQPCSGEAGTCTHRLVGSGIIFATEDPVSDGIRTEPGRVTLYAEAERPDGSLVLLEIARGQSGLTVIRYREIMEGAVLFRGHVDAPDLHIPLPDEPGPRHWTFSFDAEDDGGSGTVRHVRAGRVITVDEDRIRTTYVEAGNNASTANTRVVVLVETSPRTYDDTSSGCDPDYQPPPRTPPSVPDPNDGTAIDPDPYVPPIDPDPPVPDPDPPPDPDPYPTPDPYDDGYDDTYDDYDSGGCDDDSSTGSSDSGCEGDTTSSSSSSSAGCEGDTTSSGGDCDGCEGDTVAALPPEERTRRAALSLFRLTWPMALVGYFNRRRRRREDPLASDRRALLRAWSDDELS